MIDFYSQERQARDRHAEIVRRAEFIRRIHESEVDEMLIPATDLPTDIARLLRRAADRLDRHATRPFVRIG